HRRVPAILDDRRILRSSGEVACLSRLPAGRAPLLQRLHLRAGRGVREGESPALDGQPLRGRGRSCLPPAGAGATLRERCRPELPRVWSSSRRGRGAARRHALLLSRRPGARGGARGVRGAPPALSGGGAQRGPRSRSASASNASKGGGTSIARPTTPGL